MDDIKQHSERKDQASTEVCATDLGPTIIVPDAQVPGEKTSSENVSSPLLVSEDSKQNEAGTVIKSPSIPKPDTMQCDSELVKSPFENAELSSSGAGNDKPKETSQSLKHKATKDTPLPSTVLLNSSEWTQGANAESIVYSPSKTESKIVGGTNEKTSDGVSNEGDTRNVKPQVEKTILDTIDEKPISETSGELILSDLAVKLDTKDDETVVSFISITDVRSVQDDDALKPAVECVEVRMLDSDSEKQADDDIAQEDEKDPTVKKVLDTSSKDTEDQIQNEGNKKNGKKEDSEAKKADKKSKTTTSGENTNATPANRLCMECKTVRESTSCKFQVVVQGKSMGFLCDDKCFQAFRARQKVKTTVVPSTTSDASLTAGSSKEYCNLCRKEIRNGIGFLPGTGENKPLCSDECMKKYELANAPKRSCAQCGNAIQGRNKCLTWETMEYCNEDCLGKYQDFLGSHCAFCNNAVQRTSMGKYCVRFGLDIKQFCRPNCLEEFKKGLKVCTFCQKDISNGKEGFLAPVGNKGQFRDFCSNQCLDKYETMNSSSNQPSILKCSVCSKVAAIKVQVMYEGKSHKLCSDPCIAAFRYANKISTTICDTCNNFFDVDKTQPHIIQFEGTSKQFCAKTCMNIFVLSHRKIVPCTWCKVKKYNFDMIERVDSSNSVQLFCSLNCLSLFRVSLNATSSKCIRCDYCNNSRPAQYHLTMSDASIRNFCCYQCVMNFQGQFTNIAPVTPSQPVQAPNAATTTQAAMTSQSIQTAKTTPSVKTSQPATTTPIISSVMSLAPSQSSQVQPATPQITTAKTIAVSVPATTVSTRTTTATVSVTATATAATAATSSLSPPIQQILIKPPLPKQLKNKALVCKPYMVTKGVSCKPHPCHKSTQTETTKDSQRKPILIPVPVPIYVPVPMHMYVSPAPIPIPIPLPLPVPIFIPTTKNTVESIAKHIKEIREKIPSNPFEAEMLMMAEMAESKSSAGDENDVNEGNVLKKTDEESSDLPEERIGDENVISGEETNEEASPRETRLRTRGQKRSATARERGRKKTRTDDHSTPQTPPTPNIPVKDMVLKYTYGINAWKQWVLQKNTQLERSNRKLKLFKTDLLQLSADELNYSLCLFVKEVRKPSGEEYAADSILYLCLGIQQYLFESGRIDNIFTDAYYEKFTECLNDVLQKYDSLHPNEAYLMSRIDEEVLWESKQLGAHSPHVLLNTLMYFNTKFFNLKTVDDHLRLSFSHLTKYWKKVSGTASGVGESNPGRVAVLRCCIPAQKESYGRKRKEEQNVYEQFENVDNPLRCPVKLYEFYRSKCSEMVRSRNDLFYLFPERSCVPDSPVWYSGIPLGRDAASKMLQRIKMVREIGDPGP